MRKREDPLEELRKNQALAAAQRRDLLERLKTQQAKPKSVAETKQPGPSGGLEAALDVNAAMAAAERIHLMPFEADLGDPAALNRPTLALLRQYFEVLSSGASASILQWPSGPRDAPLLHPIAMATLLRTPKKRTTGSYVWCEPAPACRTLYFPWRGGAFYAGQRYLVRRTDITDWNQYHLTRPHAQPGATPGLAEKLHETLGHLTRLRVRDTTKPHLAHPSLSELYPFFTAEGGDRPPLFFAEAQNELLGRVRYGAALHRLADHRAALSVPETAPYGLFAVADDADFRRALAARALSANGASPHICVLDLFPAPLARLGPAWDELVEQFIAEAVKRFPGMPFLAVTQDPFVHKKVETILRQKTKPTAPISRIQLRVSTDVLTPDQVVSSWSHTQAHFSATAGPAADAINALSEAARASSDAALAGTLRREMGALRKAASLPCGLASAYEILCAKIGQAAAEAFLERRSPATLLTPIDDALASEVGGTERARLGDARAAVDRAFKALDGETPIGSLTADLLPAIARKSSRSIIAFAADADRILGEHRFADESDAGQILRRKIERGIIRFATMDELASLLTGLEHTKDRNTWKRLVVVAPGAQQLAALVTRSWLPDELFVICERTFAARLSANYQRLAAHPDLSGAGQLGPRLAAMALAAKIEVEARSAGSIELELPPNTVHDEEALIDLVDDDDDGSEVILFTLASGRRLRARPGSVIIRYNQDAELNPYERATARDVRLRQNIVVPDPGFVAEARKILPIHVLAQSWVDVYHTMVETNLSSTPGNSMNAKARTILGHMQRRGAGSSSHAAVSDWLKVSEYRQLPPEQRRPHAPQGRREFDAFVAALGISEAIADKMWLEGIQPLRINRRRAGHKMAQAFVSVLVDPHGTASHFSKDIRESISGLRKKALDHLDQVTGREVLEIEEPHD